MSFARASVTNASLFLVVSATLVGACSSVISNGALFSRAKSRRARVAAAPPAVPLAASSSGGEASGGMQTQGGASAALVMAPQRVAAARAPAKTTPGGTLSTGWFRQSWLRRRRGLERRRNRQRRIRRRRKAAPAAPPRSAGSDGGGGGGADDFDGGNADAGPGPSTGGAAERRDGSLRNDELQQGGGRGVLHPASTGMRGPRRDMREGRRECRDIAVFRCDGDADCAHGEHCCMDFASSPTMPSSVCSARACDAPLACSMCRPDCGRGQTCCGSIGAVPMAGVKYTSLDVRELVLTAGSATFCADASDSCSGNSSCQQSATLPPGYFVCR